MLFIQHASADASHAKRGNILAHRLPPIASYSNVTHRRMQVKIHILFDESFLSRVWTVKVIVHILKVHRKKTLFSQQSEKYGEAKDQTVAAIQQDGFRTGCLDGT